MSEYGKNLIRRAFDHHGGDKITQMEIYTFCKGRLHPADRKDSIDEMVQSGELWPDHVKSGIGRPTLEYWRIAGRFVAAVEDMPRDVPLVRPSGAKQRQSKKTRELIDEMRANREALAEVREALADMAARFQAFNEMMAPAPIQPGS